MEFPMSKKRKSNQVQTLNKRDVINAGRHYQQSFRQQKKRGIAVLSIFLRKILVSLFFVLCLFAFFFLFFYPNICYWKGFRAMLGGLKNNDWRITMETYCSNKKEKRDFRSFIISFYFLYDKNEKTRAKIFISFFIFVATVLPISDLWLNVCR